MAKTVVLWLIPNLFIKVSIGSVTDPVYPTGVFTSIPQMTDSIETVSCSDCLIFRHVREKDFYIFCCMSTTTEKNYAHDSNDLKIPNALSKIALDMCLSPIYTKHTKDFEDTHA